MEKMQTSNHNFSVVVSQLSRKGLLWRWSSALFLHKVSFIHLHRLHVGISSDVCNEWLVFDISKRFTGSKVGDGGVGRTRKSKSKSFREYWFSKVKFDLMN